MRVKDMKQKIGNDVLRILLEITKKINYKIQR